MRAPKYHRPKHRMMISATACPASPSTLRAILYKPFVHQVRSMRQMQEFQPEIAKIRKKYGNDRQKQAEEMQRLQKEHGVNPLGGCLPVLVPSFAASFAEPVGAEPFPPAPADPAPACLRVTGLAPGRFAGGFGSSAGAASGRWTSSFAVRGERVFDVRVTE